MTVHYEARTSISDRINELSERLYALKQAYARESRPLAPVEHNNRKKLRKWEVRQIRALWDGPGAITQRELADMFEVNPATISRIVRGVYHADN